MNPGPLDKLRELMALYWKPAASLVAVFYALTNILRRVFPILDTLLGKIPGVSSSPLKGYLIIIFCIVSVVLIVRFPRITFVLTRVILGSAPNPPLLRRIFQDQP